MKQFIFDTLILVAVLAMFYTASYFTGDSIEYLILVAILFNQIRNRQGH